MLESEGDRSLDAAEDAGRPGCFRAIPVGLAHGFAACFGSYWAFGPMQPTGQANAMRGTAHTAGIGVSGRKDLRSPDFFDKLTGRHPPGWRPVRILFSAGVPHSSSNAPVYSR